MDCSLPGFSIRGIFQARVLEWGAISFFKAFTYTQVITPLLSQCLPKHGFATNGSFLR